MGIENFLKKQDKIMKRCGSSLINFIAVYWKNLLSPKDLQKTNDIVVKIFVRRITMSSRFCLNIASFEASHAFPINIHQVLN